jgi:hypothetical protein
LATPIEAQKVAIKSSFMTIHELEHDFQRELKQLDYDIEFATRKNNIKELEWLKNKRSKILYQLRNFYQSGLY